jgi:hypothetical protein
MTRQLPGNAYAIRVFGGSVLSSVEPCKLASAALRSSDRREVENEEALPGVADCASGSPAEARILAKNLAHGLTCT